MIKKADKIEVWFRAGNGEQPQWCVSLCTAGGLEIERLSTWPDQAGAISAGKATAKDRGLEFIQREK